MSITLQNRIKKATIFIIYFFYVSVGINHFINPEWFTQIVPPFLAGQDSLLSPQPTSPYCMAKELGPCYSQGILQTQPAFHLSPKGEPRFL